jgi:hypothetical protein
MPRVGSNNDRINIMIAAKTLAACLMIASNTYQVPPAVMIGIMHVEGGRVGQQVLNRNGSYDLGPMQVNTIWLPELSKLWNVDRRTAHHWVRDNGCVNVHVAAWILRQKINNTGSLTRGIGHYHSATPWRSQNYLGKVVNVMEAKGLIDHGSSLKTSRVKLAQR